MISSKITYTILLAVTTLSYAQNSGIDEICTTIDIACRQCNGRHEDGSMEFRQNRRGKAGPVGEKGEKGAPANVDYDQIESSVQQYVKEFSTNLWEKYNRCESLLQNQTKELENIRKELRKLSVGADCSEVLPESFKSGSANAGIFDIFMKNEKKTMEVFCDMKTDGGKWTVIQRRMDGSVDFFRNYDDYVEGFGNKTGEFWIGLDNMHNLVTGRNFELRIELEDWDGVKKYAKYSQFSVGAKSDNYVLKISGYSGTAPDGFTHNNGMGFSTKDRDIDTWSSNCADAYKGAWWYTGCMYVNLNGFYFTGASKRPYGQGIVWSKWKGYYYSLKFVEMKIRPAA